MPSSQIAAGALSSQPKEDMVTVHSKTNCPQCTATIRLLEREGIEHEVIDITERDDLLTQFKEEGLLAAPVVVTDSDRWAGFDPDRIKAIAA